MYCRTCGNKVYQNAEVCTKCGCKPFVGTSFCNSCGVKTLPQQVVCTKCGIKLKRVMSTSEIKSATKSGSKKIIANTCTVIAILLYIASLINLGSALITRSPYYAMNDLEASSRCGIVATIFFIISIVVRKYSKKK